MSDHGTTAASSLTQDLTQSRPGDHLEAADQEVVQHQGIVADPAPEVGVVRARDTGIGERKMLTTDDSELRISRSTRLRGLEP